MRPRLASILRPAKQGLITGRSAGIGAESAAAFRRLASLALIALLCVVVTAAFWPALGNQFLNWDDDRNFVDNEDFVASGLPLIRWAWSTYHLGVWQPLSWCLLSLQYSLGALDPTVYHAVSLLLHIVNVVVLYLLTVAILRKAVPERDLRSPLGARLAAASSSLLFAVHPLRVEAVTWMSCQPYLPAVFFFMLAVWSYLRGCRDGLGQEGPRRLWLLLTFVLYVLAVMCKAVAVTLPVILLLLDAYPLRRFTRHTRRRGRTVLLALIEKLPFLAVGLVVSIWAAEAKEFSETRAPFVFAALPARLAQSAYALLFYLSKTVAPRELIAYYELPSDISIWAWPYAACGGAVLAITIALILLRHRCPGAIIAWSAYALILLPNLGLVQISRQIAADRYSYLAVVPLMILLAAGLLKLLDRAPAAGPSSSWTPGGWLSRAAPLAIVAMAVVAMTLASRRQTRMWQDSVSLWEATLAVNPECAVAECNLAVAFIEQGRYTDASSCLSRAINLQQDFAFAHANFGILLLKAKRPEEAVVALEEALARGGDLGPRDLSKVHASLGAAYAALRRDDLAWKHTREAQRLGFTKAAEMIEYLRKFSPEPED